MDVRQLSYVVAVVDHGGFTRAAEALGISQPSLSQGVRALERELGVELFVRRARPVRLTQGYQVVLPPAGRASVRRGRGTAVPRWAALAAQPTVAVADLAEVPLVTTPPGSSIRRAVDQALARTGRTPTLAVETDHRESLIPLVLAGAGVAVIPDSLVPSATRQGAMIRPLDRPLSRRVGLIHRRDPLSPAAAAFVALATPDPT
jgi:DNA-binding transcriptional LysR family regulator